MAKRSSKTPAPAAPTSPDAEPSGSAPEPPAPTAAKGRGRSRKATPAAASDSTSAEAGPESGSPAAEQPPAAVAAEVSKPKRKSRKASVPAMPTAALSPDGDSAPMPAADSHAAQEGSEPTDLGSSSSLLSSMGGAGSRRAALQSAPVPLGHFDVPELSSQAAGGQAGEAGSSWGFAEQAAEGGALLELQGSVPQPLAETQAELLQRTADQEFAGAEQYIEYGADSGLDDAGFEKALLRDVLGTDIYKQLRADHDEDATLPEKYKLRYNSISEYSDLITNLTREYWMRRRMERDAVHDVGWAAHHISRQNAVNIYANARRVAGIMHEFENDDYKLGPLAPHHIAPWARAEIIFNDELPAFNQHLKDNEDLITRRLPREAEDEELDILDEALFLLRTDDSDSHTAQQAQQANSEQEMLDLYLEGTLPGATLDNLAAAYAEDIFSTNVVDDFTEIELDDDAVAGAGDLQDGMHDSTVSTPPPAGKKGRKAKAKPEDEDTDQ